MYPNETLIYNGYLGCSPLYPNIAISLCTLAAYRQAHRTCPQFSIQAQCKMLCYLHDMLYRPYLRSQFLAAYDAFLEIVYRVDVLLKQTLKHDTPNWRLLNVCLPCTYKLVDEPPLQFTWFATIDSNNILKHWASLVHNSVPHDDSHQPRSDYWIGCDVVDKFKDKVRSITALNKDDNVDDWQDVCDDREVPGEIPFHCTARWCNAGPEQRKKMFSVFDESGIFIAACRHHFVLVACNMIRSGELAKYPLALIDHLMTVYGQNGLCAYDIGCAFLKTLSTSSLCPRAHALALCMMVGAFHGHAHNRKCQLDWHPMYISGTGHTEGEGCEHIFSSSNELARSLRHASPFHHHQSIEEHFGFWDADKYTALSNFLFNHYREAIHGIQTLQAELSIIKYFVKFYNKEKLYLDRLKEPPIQDRLCIRYVEVLDDLELCREEWNTAQLAANNALTTIGVSNFSEISTALTTAHICVDAAYAKLQNAEALVAHMEIQLHIEQCWVIGGPKYVQFKDEAALGKYHTVLNELERLVVMRLFELSKLSLSGTGYKLCQQIGKALQCRSEAIHNEINWYNTQAAALNPPHPKLSWKDIAEYSFLGEFDLLCHSRTDIWELDWTKPAHCEATTKYFKLLHAQEEVSCLNVEEIETKKVINDLQSSNPLLASELQQQWRSRSATNVFHIFCLNQIEGLPGYSGAQGIGEEHAEEMETMGSYLNSIVDSAVYIQIYVES
ncbi:uncharacterized protein F5891DRAFT_1130758 [Suillus fuscotomentosus]|uniref:CxC2-like cysteine cluster KDZ transposase-associated domain-containing protein n=1 Tax=Suillus fuscotomentosus TaxID=1912939 RepID=A0AAD4HG53_9AGAM|nr:uncharacterized protein F5891DRAFT_1130758 [Suillus fuscotomentosus]KAG1894971.1 hypothetical protein F5891DRAFT_1130758 [Suillus fuscotomentosus]